MTVFYNSFGADVINAAPSGFNFLQNWPKKVTPDTFQVRADANNLISGKQLYLNTGDYDGMGAAVYNQAGMFNDGEFLAVLKGGSYNYIVLGLNISNTATTANVIQLDDNGAGFIRARVMYTNNGVNSFLTSGTNGDKDTAGNGTLFGSNFYIRVRKTGQQLQVKFWQFGQPEPATWLIDFTSANVKNTPGYFGVLYDNLDNSAFYANNFYMPYFSVATTSGEVALLPPKLIKGTASLVVNAGGKLLKWKLMKAQAGLKINANLKTANPVFMKSTVGIITNAKGKARVNWRLKGQIGLQVQATGDNGQSKKIKASVNLQTNTKGKIIKKIGLKGGANLSTNGYGELHGKKIRFVNGLKANLVVNLASKMAANFVIGANANITISATANLRINRFISRYPPSLFIFNNDNLVAVFGNGPNACRYYNPVHTEQIFNKDTVSNSQTENTFKFTVRKHDDLKYLKIGAVVVFRDLDNEYQAFEIANISEKHKTYYEMEITCNNQFIELNDDYIENKITTTGSVAHAVNIALSNSRWQLGIVNPTLGDHQFTLGHQSALKGLAHIVAVAKCELVFRVEIAGQKIIGRYVDVKRLRGSDTGKRFVYGKDTTSIYRETDDTTLKTAVYAFGKYDDVANTYVRIAGVEWRGYPYDNFPSVKPLASPWIGDDEAKALWGRSGRHRYGEYYNDDITDQNILIQAAWDYLQTINKPVTTYEMEAMELERLTGFSHEKVRIGDTVGAIDSEFTPTLRLKARVLQIDRNLSDPTKTKFIIGNFIPSVFGVAKAF
jgi:phage minor structural protein